MSILARIGFVLLCVLVLTAGFIAALVGVDLSSMMAALLGALLLLVVGHAVAGRCSVRRPANATPSEHSQRSIV